jgi:hypothetical protein
MGSINNLTNIPLTPILPSALPTAREVSDKAAGGTTGIGASSDKSQLSPFAQLVSTLQQLQQSDPAKYQQVTQQIATNLQSAAQTDQANGNTTAANQLKQLAADFSNASKSGQLPNFQDLAKAVGGHHHHHHGHANSADSDGSSSSATQAVNQLLLTQPPNGTVSSSLNPFTIIQKALSNAGITRPNS